MYLDESLSINEREKLHLTSSGRIRDPNSYCKLGSQFFHIAVVMNVFMAIFPAELRNDV